MGILIGGKHCFTLYNLVNVKINDYLVKVASFHMGPFDYENKNNTYFENQTQIQNLDRISITAFTYMHQADSVSLFYFHLTFIIHSITVTL